MNRNSDSKNQNLTETTIQKVRMGTNDQNQCHIEELHLQSKSEGSERENKSVILELNNRTAGSRSESNQMRLRIRTQEPGLGSWNKIRLRT